MSFKFNPFTSNFDISDGISAIGDSISGATDKSVLFVDGTTLAQDNTNFNYDKTTQILTVSGRVYSPILDRSSAGTLTIGGTNATIINIGNAGCVVNIQGTTLYENVTQLQVTDPLITLNKGGGVGSAANSGVELEENSLITAYVETSGTRNNWLMKAPNTAGIITFTPGVAGFTIDQGSHNPVTIVDSNSIDLTLTVQQLQADLRISSNAADANNLIVNLDIESTSSVGLRAQITNSSIRGLFSATTPLFYNNSTGNFTIQVATALQNGYLSSTDWSTFNNKVDGPGSATDNAIARFDGTTGKLIQNSGASIDDSGNLTATNFSGSSSGTNTGDVTLAAFGSSPSASGASLSGQVLTLQPADATHPGGVSILAQSFAGLKTFLNSAALRDTGAAFDLTLTSTSSPVLSAGRTLTIDVGNASRTLTISGTANISGTNTGDVTIGTANGLSLSGQVLSLQLSSTTLTGALSSTDWNTFNNKANNTLNNLGTTSINADLLPSADNTRSIGSSSLRWLAADISSVFGTAFGSRASTTTSAVTLSSGNASAGNSGNITISTGTATGTRGTLFVDGHHVQGFGWTTSGTIQSGAVILGGIDATANVGFGSAVFGGLNGAGALNANKATGNGDFVAGILNLVTANFSGAMGENNSVSQTHAFAFGQNNTVSGDGAFACGIGHTASGNKAFTCGNQNTASSTASFAGGQSTLASGTQSAAFGESTQATALNSFAKGENCHANARGSSAEGSATTTTTGALYSHAEGISTTVTAAGLYGHAEGNLTSVQNIAAHAEGESGVASGRGSHAEGNSGTASGDYSHVEGQACQATALYAHAEGLSNTASGQGAHAEGFNANVASGKGSHAGGTVATSSGDFSFAHGDNNTAQGYAQFVLGRFNTLQGTAGSWTTGDDLFVLGNGTGSGSRSNAATITNEGLRKWSGGAREKTRASTSATTTVSATTDYWIGINVAGAATVNLPAGVEGQEFIIQDTSGAALVNNITINRAGSDTFQGGGTSISIVTNYGVRSLIFSSGVWYILALL